MGTKKYTVAELRDLADKLDKDVDFVHDNAAVKALRACADELSVLRRRAALQSAALAMQGDREKLIRAANPAAFTNGADDLSRAIGEKK